MYTLKEITDFIYRPGNILTYASDSFEMMDDIIFFSGNMNGYNISHLKFSQGPISENVIDEIEFINSLDVNNINEGLDYIDLIFKEKSIDRCKGSEEDFEGYSHYETKDIKIAVMITRFKSSDYWLEFFMEDGEIELALHNSYEICISHLLLFFTGGEC